MKPARVIGQIANFKSLAAVLALIVASQQLVVANDNILSVKSRDTRTPIVELYTSEGCSSCPRADKWLSELGTHLGEELHALPLAFHVTYWNYLGWEDPFSQEAFTQRQRELASLNRQTSIYTPEFMVSGKEARSGMDIVDRIALANKQPSPVTITLMVSRQGDNRISAAFDLQNSAESGSFEARVVIFESDIMREIKGGENRGKSLTYDFVVRHFSPAMSVIEGASDQQLEVKLGEDWNRDNLGIAVVVSDVREGETIQTVSTSLDSLFSEG